MSWIRFVLGGILGSVFLVGGSLQTGEYCLLEQDFVKFGKRDTYEQAQKEQLLKKDRSKEIRGASARVYEDPDNSEYLIFTFLENFQDVEKALSVDRATSCSSCLNFFIRSLYLFLPECSSSVPDKTPVAMSYFFFGLPPGQDAPFETHLRALHSSEKKVLWKTWKALIGGDQPRYLIAVFGATPKDSQDNAQAIEFVPQSLKQNLRKEKSGIANLRQDLYR